MDYLWNLVWLALLPPPTPPPLLNISVTKTSLAVVTLYSTLGEDAIIHGINETEVTHVITTAELLPKIKVRNPPLTLSLWN